MQNKKILITGGAGFIGRNLIERLSKSNKVIVLDKVKSPFKKSIIADTRKTDWHKKIKKVDYIFHLASIVGVDYVAAYPHETTTTEILGMKNIINFAKKHGVKKIIYSSTSSVHEALDSPTCYNTSKLFAEQHLRESGLNYSIIRYFNVYGKHQKEKMVVSRFINNALKNKPIVVFEDGKQTRDFTFIEDAIKATIFIAESQKADFQTIDVGTGVETNILELARQIKTTLNSKSKIIHKEPSELRKPFEVSSRVSDVKKLKESIGFECKISLKEGLLKTISKV